ncbi:MAG: hypothetical protein KIS92_03740 [Planctomycetota bacterium]|nr:hypothetical protein [Planctomycetota bacterium]
MYVLAGLVLGSVLLPYVLGPILVKATQAQAVRATFRPLDGTAPDLPGDAKAFFEAGIPPLLELGFTPLACMEMSHYVKNVKVYFTILEHREHCDYAMLDAFYLVFASGECKHRSMHTEFISLLTPERSVTTNNSSESVATPPVPGREKYFFRNITDSQRLYRAHQALARRAHAGTRMPLSAWEPDARVLQESISREHAFLSGQGYLRLDETAQQYRLTWKGAILMTWRLCWPVKQIRMAGDGRRAEALLRELGV